MSKPLQLLSMRDIRRHYLRRKRIGKEMHHLLSVGDDLGFASLALGITDTQGNYSAAEHGLGPKILSQRPPSAICDLARNIIDCDAATAMLDCVYGANVPWLKVSVGSEIAMLLKPHAFWVANTRTVWAHLLLKHNFATSKANEELQLYRSGDQNSEMAYRIWKALYLEIGSSVVGLTAIGDAEASDQQVRPGKQKNLWFDAIANATYEELGG